MNDRPAHPHETHSVRYWVYSAFGDAIFSGPRRAEALAYAQAAKGRTMQMVVESTARTAIPIDTARPAIGSLTDDELAEALNRPSALAQLPALIMANIEDVPNWRDNNALLTAHAHAYVLHNDLPGVLPVDAASSAIGPASAPEDQS